MTGLAANFAVRRLEWELGFFVIIKCLAPGRFDVTILTTVPKVLIVAIVFLVAAKTRDGYLTIFYRCTVALIATHVGVRSA